jgi:hypothetical protein
MLQPLAPPIEEQLAEHHELAEIVRDRAELLERMSSLARQLDALTHRALAVGVDVEQLAPPPPAPTHGRPPRKGTRKGRRPAREPRRGPAKPRRAPGVRHANGEGTKEQLLVWLGGRDEPASVVQMVEALGVHRTSIDQAIAKCNGQLAKVQEARGPKPALYLRADQLPREGWPHTEREARAQHVPDWVNPEEERAGAVKRRGEGLREKGAILPAEAEAEPVEPEEPIEEPTAEPEEVTPDQVEHPEPTEEEAPEADLGERALGLLWEHGALRVEAIAELLDADPVDVARVMRDHKIGGKIRRQNDGAYVAQPVTV